MNVANCGCKCKCTLVAVIASVFIGIVTAFLQFAGVITVAPVFLWVTFGIAVGYLAVLVIASALSRNENLCDCLCNALNTLLLGIVGTILFSAVLLAVGIVAESAVSAILLGLVLLFFALIITVSACVVRCLFDCGE